MKGVYEMTFTVTECFINATFTYTVDIDDLDALVSFLRGFGDHPAKVDVNAMTIVVNMPYTRCVHPETRMY